MSIGYNDFTKAYRVYEFEMRKILMTQDVVFDESRIDYHQLKLSSSVYKNSFDFSASHLNIESETNNRKDELEVGESPTKKGKQVINGERLLPTHGILEHAENQYQQRQRSH